MDVLLRHTLLGEYFVSHTEEHDPSLLKRFRTLQDAERQGDFADESTRLLEYEHNSYDSDTRLVDWYSNDDPDVSIPFMVRAQPFDHFQDPSKWPLVTKWAVTVVLCRLTLLITAN